MNTHKRSPPDSVPSQLGFFPPHRRAISTRNHAHSRFQGYKRSPPCSSHIFLTYCTRSLYSLCLIRHGTTPRTRRHRQRFRTHYRGELQEARHYPTRPQHPVWCSIWEVCNIGPSVPQGIDGHHLCDKSPQCAAAITALVYCDGYTSSNCYLLSFSCKLGLMLVHSTIKARRCAMLWNSMSSRSFVKPVPTCVALPSCHSATCSYSWDAFRASTWSVLRSAQIQTRTSWVVYYVS